MSDFTFDLPPVGQETERAEEMTDTIQERDELAQVNESSSIEAQISALKAEIQEAKDLLLNFKTENIKPVDEQIDLLNSTERALTEEYTKNIRKVRDTRKEYESERMKLLAQLQALENNMSQNSSEIARLTQLLAAQKEMEGLRDSLSKFFKETKWGPKLRDYQAAEIMTLVERYRAGEFSVMNADIMGAGKTIVTIAGIEILREEMAEKLGRIPTVLWITSKNLRMQTIKEFNRWYDQPIITLIGDANMRTFALEMAVRSNFMVTVNYDMLRTTPAILDYEWDIVVADEASQLKNSKSDRFALMEKLLHGEPDQYGRLIPGNGKVSFYMPLTGTPIENAIEDMYSHLHLANPKRFPSLKAFVKEFTWKEYNYATGKYEIRYDREQVLRAMVGKVIRTDKNIINAQKPKRDRGDIFTERTPAQDAVYQKIKQGILDFLERESEKKASLNITAVIAQLNYLRQANVWPAGITVKNDETGELWVTDCNESGKLDEAMELIDTLHGEDENVVVWSTFKEPLAEMKRRLTEKEITCEILSGDVNDRDRENIRERFLNNEIRVLLCSTLGENKGNNFGKSEKWSGGASRAIFLDLWWNPAVNDQAEQRIWRVDSTEPVMSYRLFVESSVDSLMLSLIAEKEEMAGIVDRDELRPAKEWLDMLRDSL